MLTPFPAATSAISSLTAANPQLLPSFVHVCSQLAPPMSVLVSLAPLPTIHHLKTRDAAGDDPLPLLPYSCMAANGGLWTTYGLLKQKASIWAPNLVGALLAVYYISEFIKNVPHAANSTTTVVPVHRHVNTLIAAAATTVAAVLANVRADVFGQAAVLLCIALFASPLSTIKSVLETKSARSIPLPFTIASVVACLTWSITGVCKLRDPNVILPNALGLAFGLAQVCLKLVFRDNNAEKPIERIVTTQTETKSNDYALATP